MSTETIQLLERLTGLIKKEVRNLAFASNLQPVQLDALIYLSMCNRYSDTPIAVTEYLGFTKGTVSQTLKRLEAKFLIEKQNDARDKRLVHLKLTPAGRRLLAQIYPPPQLASVLSELPRSINDLLVSLIKQLSSEYKDTTDNRGFGVCHKCQYHRRTERGFRCSLKSESIEASDINLICRNFLEAH